MFIGVDFCGRVSNLVLSIVLCAGSMPEAGVVMEEGELPELIENVIECELCM